MKILHIVAGEINGGAAKGAHILHKELIKQNINSSMLTNAKNQTLAMDVNSIITGKTSRIFHIIRNQMDSLLFSIYKKDKGGLSAVASLA